MTPTEQTAAPETSRSKKKPIAAPLGKQQQAKADAPKKPARRTARPKEEGVGGAKGKAADVTSDVGKQQQAPDTSGSLGKQGTGTTGEMRGGTKQVLISEAVITKRSGRPPNEEDYPFGDLAPAQKKDGVIIGPSFFIPDSDRAAGKLAAARKRHKEADGTPGLFWSRKVTEVPEGGAKAEPGLRIWRGTPELKNEV